MQGLVSLIYLSVVVAQDMKFQITVLCLELQLVRPQKQKCEAIIQSGLKEKTENHH
jgi:hypothetical protein